MALSGALQSFFILVIVVVYTATVWKSLDSYFRDEFKKHLEKDLKSIDKLKRERSAIAKENRETNKIEGVMETITDTITEATLAKLNQEKPNNCKKKNQNVHQKYTISREESEEDYFDNNGICAFTPNENAALGGGG